MSIDDNWEDMMIYVVEMTMNDSKIRSKIFIFNVCWNEEKITEILLEAIPNIKKVNFIDELGIAWNCR